ncbi:Hypothetical predicted protein [Octopus vulgaris]|uniref:Uncharacterized protein n=1 Tax=Octopus vulgaris TaxID=6645 RepID=A0AA36C209_OCTVU|nr:Hypothetical predicted protein [Octopus vulgaris]
MFWVPANPHFCDNSCTFCLASGSPWSQATNVFVSTIATASKINPAPTSTCFRGASETSDLVHHWLIPPWATVFRDFLLLPRLLLLLLLLLLQPFFLLLLLLLLSSEEACWLGHVAISPVIV